jgi:hypothetical protein
MHSAFWSGVLTLAILAGVAAPRQLHLHAANGVRTTHDALHQDAAGEPLLHSHATPHEHDDSGPEDGEPEDVLAVTDGVLPATTLHAGDLTMLPERPVTLSPPLAAHRSLTVHQPPSHAPPARTAVGSRGPPPAAS